MKEICTVYTIGEVIYNLFPSECKELTCMLATGPNQFYWPKQATGLDA